MAGVHPGALEQELAMHFNWSALDGLLAVVVVIIILWAAFKLVTRLVIGVILLIVLAALFFGLHLNELGGG